MTKKFFVRWIVFPSIVACAMSMCKSRVGSIETLFQLQKPKKKIVIFTSPGGGGHMAVTRALNSYLSDEYIIEPHNIFQDVLGAFDPIEKITFGHIAAEETYNFFITRKFYRTLNAIAFLGQWYFDQFREKITKKITEFLVIAKPDLVISVVPFVNKAILTASKECSIPFLLIPTDLDLRTFIKNIELPDYKDFHISIPFDDQNILKLVTQKGIPVEQISVNGFPLRLDFFCSKNIPALKKEFDVPENKPVIMVIMGAAGSTATYNYVKHLAKIEEPIHLIVMLGRNEQLKPQIEAIPLNKNQTITIFGFTERIADLMAISDICITKSGSVSFCEALYSNIPILLDGTTTTIKWERFNHQYTEEKFIGYIVRRSSTIPQLVSQLLHNPKIVAQMKKNLHMIEKKRPDVRIKNLVNSLIANQK